MKSLIAYYSHTGITRRAAQTIQAAVGGDLYEIKEREPYPREYNAVVKQAKQEISSGYLPPLQNDLPDVSGYDLVLIGSPNWWSTIAPPVATFLHTLDLSGKQVIPFLTHGGGGLGRVNQDIRKLCPTADIADCIDANRSDALLRKISQYT